MKTYAGIRNESSNRLRVMRLHVGRPLPLYLNELNHSPSEFECGYVGEGPSQLAYAILRDCLGPTRALELYQAFLSEVISQLPLDSDWFLLEEDINDWLVLNSLNVISLRFRYTHDYDKKPDDGSGAPAPQRRGLGGRYRFGR